MGRRGPQKLKLTGLLADFAEHLKTQGYSASTAEVYTKTARQFLKHVGHERIDRISEAETRAFFDRYKPGNRRNYGARINLFLQFAMKGLPVVVDQKGADAQRFPVDAKSRKELALRQAWEAERKSQEKEANESVVAQLARQLINQYLHFKARIKGAPDDPDDLYRFAAECEVLIQGNILLFMELSAKGLNIHSLINERVESQ